MKKKIITICIILLIMIISIAVYLSNRKPVFSHENVIDMNGFVIDDTNDTILFSYNDYIKYFNNNVIDENSFINNNYAVIKLEYDPCTDEDIMLTNYVINGNQMDVYFEYNQNCGVCPQQYNYYLIAIDKNINNLEINKHYKVNNKAYCDPTVSYKPMIYLYPEEDMFVSVKLGKPQLLTTTYPKYHDGWNLYAKTNGDLIINNRLYYGLYWEGFNNISNDIEDGFVVNRNDLIPFFEEKLSILGLTDREANEFIVYWLPILEKNDYNLIRFENQNIIDEQMPLEIDPKPDNIIRVLMEYCPVDSNYVIKKQELTTPVRSGFTVVEWGGTLI